MIERLTAAIYEACKERVEWSGSYLTDRHPETGVFNFDGEMPVPEIIKHVLAAMREPTEGMLKAGVIAPNYLEDQSSRRGCGNIFTAMIDAALAEEG